MGKETRKEFLIREGLLEDAEAIYEIGRKCFTDAWRKETVAHDLRQPLSRYLVAEIENEVVAFACFWFVADEAQLVNVGVHPDFRRLGIAKELIQKGIEKGLEEAMETLYLEVRVSNLPAQTLYKKLGLEILTRRKEVYDLPKEDGFIMSGKLRALINEDL